MPVRLVAADPRVEADRGKRSVQRGPLVYCMEECDNPDYDSCVLTPATKFETEFRPDLLGGVMTIIATQGDKRFFFIPYYAWDNREAGKMKVWVDYKE